MKRLLTLTLLLISLAACVTATPATPTLPAPPPTDTPTPAPVATATPTPIPTATPLPPLALQQQWEYPTAENWHETEAFWTLDIADLDGDGVPEILSGAHDRYFYAFAADGSVRWKFKAEAVIYSALVITLPDGSPRILAGDDSDRVYLLDAQGSAVWQARLDGRVTHLAAFGDTLLAATWTGTLAAFDLSGAAKWTTQLPAAPVSLEAASLGGADILAGLRSGHVLGLGADGKTMWDIEVSSQPVAAHATTADGIAWISADQGGTLTAWGADGSRRWQLAFGGGIPVWAQAELPTAPGFIVGTGDPVNLVVALSREGKIRWQTPVEGGVWDVAAADLDGDGAQEILAATEGGSVTVLSAAGTARGAWHAPSRVVEMQVAAIQPGGAPQIVLREGRFIHMLNSVVNGIPSPIPTRGPPTLPSWDGKLPSEEGTVLFAAVGDVMLARTVEEYAGKYGVDYPFAPVASALKQADISVGNLEHAVSLGGSPVTKTYVFRAHPDMVSGLSRSGLNTMSLANNHILDFGNAGLFDTLRHLQDNDIATFGAGANRAEAEAPLIYDIRGVKVALVAWVSYAPADFAAGESRPGVAYLNDLNRMARQISEAKRQADVVVAILHGGKEYDLKSNAQQQEAAHRAIDAGADLVVGHHTHTLQETEIYAGRLIAYSLGDFVFDIDNYDFARDGAVLWAWLGKDGVRRVELWRTRIVHDAQVRFLARIDGQPNREVLLSGE